MFGGDGKPEAAPVLPGYSTAPGPAAQEQAETTIDFDSGSEFSRAIDGRDAYSVWAVMDELMETIRTIYPRLYDAVMAKL